MSHDQSDKNQAVIPSHFPETFLKSWQHSYNPVILKTFVRTDYNWKCLLAEKEQLKIKRLYQVMIDIRNFILRIFFLQNININLNLTQNDEE